MNLDVVYSSDDNYAQHVGVSMLSLFENNKSFGSINIYLIENRISMANKNNLVSICEKYNRKLKFIDFYEYSNNLNLNMEHHISTNAYARLFLPRILEKSIDKIIYLDCDSIINSSLSNLWRLDISNYYVAGVCDTVNDNTKLKINLDLNKSYINSGMLLINMKKWREEYVEEKFLNFIESYNGNVFHHDQGVINGVLNKKILLLHPKYNAMTPFYTMGRKQMMQYYGLKKYYIEDELEEARMSPVFIHYTPAFVSRPWIKGCKHPLASLYKKYLDMTPWQGSTLSNDNRKKGEKLISFLFNNFPFKIANGIRNLIFK